MKSIHDLIKQHLKESGSATAQQIAEAIRHPIREVRAAIRLMCIEGVMQRMDSDYWKKEFEPRYELVYSTSKGQPIAQRPAWTGTDWTHATARPGCLDYQRVPSLMNGKRVPYRTPRF